MISSTYWEVAIASEQEGPIQDGESLGGSLDVTRQRGELAQVVGYLLGGDAGGNGGKASNEESSETHLGKIEVVGWECKES